MDGSGPAGRSGNDRGSGTTIGARVSGPATGYAAIDVNVNTGD